MLRLKGGESRRIDFPAPPVNEKAPDAADGLDRVARNRLKVTDGQRETAKELQKLRLEGLMISNEVLRKPGKNCLAWSSGKNGRDRILEFFYALGLSARASKKLFCFARRAYSCEAQSESIWAKQNSPEPDF